MKTMAEVILQTSVLDLQGSLALARELSAAGFGPVREAAAEALRDAANELEWHPGTQAWLRVRANVVEAAS